MGLNFSGFAPEIPGMDLSELDLALFRKKRKEELDKAQLFLTLFNNEARENDLNSTRELINRDIKESISKPENAEVIDSTSTRVEGNDDSEKKGFFGKSVDFLSDNSKDISLAADTVGNIAGSFVDNYDGPKGHITQAIDLGWDSASNAVSKLGPYGAAAGAAMKAIGALNKISSAITGGTDGMTTTDAVFDSPLGMLTGVGWINQAFGDTADTITKDEETFEQVGASYGGTGNIVDDALTKSGKKYGAFSGKAKHEANLQIANAKALQNIMASVALDSANRNAIKSSMAAINGNARLFNLNGGYNQAAIHVGKQGMRIERIRNVINKVNNPIKNLVEDEELVEDSIETFKDGGIIEEIPTFVYEEALPEFIFESAPNEVDKFAKGGAFNVIPEGALHARKHNLDIEGITKKGIPVVSESEGGEIQQQAEIEHSEIILRLEVTLKLEKLMKKYESNEYTLKEKDEFAIEAGKLLTEEILYNTNDNVNLINNI